MPCCRAHIESLIIGWEPRGHLKANLGRGSTPAPGSAPFQFECWIHMKSAHDPRAPQGTESLYHEWLIVKQRNKKLFLLIAGFAV